MTILWSHVHTTSHVQGLYPTNYGWEVDSSLLQPAWFEGPAIPDSLFHSDEDANIESDRDSDQTAILSQSEETVNEIDDLHDRNDYDLCEDEPWNKDSDSDTEEME